MDLGDTYPLEQLLHISKSGWATGSLKENQTVTLFDTTKVCRPSASELKKFLLPEAFQVIVGGGSCWYANDQHLLQMQSTPAFVFL